MFPARLHYECGAVPMRHPQVYPPACVRYVPAAIASQQFCVLRGSMPQLAGARRQKPESCTTVSVLGAGRGQVTLH